MLILRDKMANYDDLPSTKFGGEGGIRNRLFEFQRIDERALKTTIISLR